MIKKLIVDGLNNRCDIDNNLPFHFHQDLNIFTGSNGSGKTTLLKLIWYLVSGNLERILPEIPFKSVSIETDPFTLTITSNDSGKFHFFSENNNFSRIVDFTVPEDHNTRSIRSRNAHANLHDLNVDIARAMKSSLFFPTFRRIEGGFSSVSDYDDSRQHLLPNRILRDSSGSVEQTLQEAISDFSTVLSVYDKILYDHRFVASISTYDIVRLLERKHSVITDEANKRHSNSSDQIAQEIRHYLVRSTQNLQEAKHLLDDIQKRLEKVDKEQEELFQPISVLSDYVGDFFTEYEIRITENITLGQDTEAIANAISSDKLSAGEKQMLSFLCYNAFREKSPIFIDEPELSLHIDWQRSLISTLLKQATGNQFFIATHSPFIYSKYPDKEFLLGKDRGGEI